MIDIYKIRARYTTPDNACKAAEIEQLASIAIAHDISTLVSIIEARQARIAMLEAELNHLQEALNPPSPVDPEPLPIKVDHTDGPWCRSMDPSQR